MVYIFLLAFSLVAAAYAEVPENDQCIQREKLRPYEPIYGNTTEANFDYNNQGVCGARSDRPAVWYEVRGLGAQVTVKVCTNNEVITDFGVIEECNTQKCLGAPDQTFEPASCDLGESVDYSWVAERDVQYFVQVRSDVIDGVGSNFTIVYEDDSLDGTLPPGESVDGASGASGSPSSGGGGNANGGSESGHSNPPTGIAILTIVSASVALFF